MVFPQRVVPRVDSRAQSVTPTVWAWPLSPPPDPPSAHAEIQACGLPHRGRDRCPDRAPALAQLGRGGRADTLSRLGVYAGGGNVSGANALGQSIGKNVPYAMDFLDGTSWSSIQDPKWFAQQWAGSSYQMIWGVPILPNTGRASRKGPRALTTTIS